MRRLLLTMALLTGTALFTPALHADGYTFFTIDYPAAGPNISTTAFGINNLGQIVGSYSELQKLTTHGFLFENGAFTTIDLPNSQNTEAHGINDIGTIVGQTLSSTAGGYAGFVKQGDVVRIIRNGILAGINNAGLMVGTWRDSSAPSASRGFFGFVSNPLLYELSYPSSVSSQLVGVNNLGAVIGSYQPSAGSADLGFISIAGAFATGDSTSLASVNCLNDSFAFGGSINMVVNRGFVSANGGFTMVDVPGATSTTVNGINNAGTIVGSYTDANGSTHGFVAIPTP